LNISSNPQSYLIKKLLNQSNSRRLNTDTIDNENLGNFSSKNNAIQNKEAKYTKEVLLLSHLIFLGQRVIMNLVWREMGKKRKKAQNRKNGIWDPKGVLIQKMRKTTSKLI